LNAVAAREFVIQFELDDSLVLNVAAAGIAGVMAWLCWRYMRDTDGGMHHHKGGAKWSIQDIITGAAILWLLGGLPYFVIGRF
jgi:hypothetical protein